MTTKSKTNDKPLRLTSNMRRGPRVHPPIDRTTHTKPEFAPHSDVNYLVKQFKLTGIVPAPRQHLAQYINVKEIPDLQTAFELTRQAKNSFKQLPAEFRKILDNDPTKLESFIQNPANIAVLKHFGILTEATKDPAPKEAPRAPTEPKETPQGT